MQFVFEEDRFIITDGTPNMREHNIFRVLVFSLS